MDSLVLVNIYVRRLNGFYSYIFSNICMYDCFTKIIIVWLCGLITNLSGDHYQHNTLKYQWDNLLMRDNHNS